MGIEITVDETKVGHIPLKAAGRCLFQDGYVSGPTKTLLMQIAEMGMLYRKVTRFIESRQTEGKGGMTEQVRVFIKVMTDA